MLDILAMLSNQSWQKLWEHLPKLRNNFGANQVLDGGLRSRIRVDGYVKLMYG